MDDVPTPAQSNEDSYERVLVSIEASDGIFALFIAVCDDRAFREKVVQRYEEELAPEIALQRLTLSRGEPSLRAAIAVWEESHPEFAQRGRRAVLSVTGAEELLAINIRSDDAEQTEQEKFLGYLQWTREAIGHFPYPIILWVTSRILRLISRKAPDFWSWRRGVFRFVSDEVPTLPREERPALPQIFGSQMLRSNDRDNDDFPLPLEDLQDLIAKTESQQGADSPMLATLYDRVAQAYVRRVVRGEAVDPLVERKLAVNYFYRAIELQMKHGLEFDRVSTLTHLGNFYESQGQFPAAIDCHQQVLELARQISHRQGEASALNNLGNAYESLGQYERAIQFYQQSLEIEQKIGNKQGEATSLGNLGNAYHFLGQYERAIEFHQLQLSIARQIHDYQSEAIALNNLGIASRPLGQYDQAIDFYEQSLRIERQVENRRNEAKVLGNLGNTYYSLKQYEQAVKLHLQALKIAREIGDVQWQASCLSNLGNAYDSQGQHEWAIQFYQQSLEISRQIGDRRGEAITWFNLAGVLKKLGRKGSCSAYEKARILYQEMGLDQDAQECDDAIARLEQATSDVPDLRQ